MKKRTVAAIISLAAIVGCTAWAYSAERSGLFNNRHDVRHAMSDHEAAWRQAGLDETLTRPQLKGLIDRYQADCITERSDWSRVNIDAPLTNYADARQPVACHFRIRGRWPRHFPESYIWTLVLMPTSADELRLQATRRNTFTD